jgi:glycosyltransferase involved in cell wall biosynthesis
MSASPDRSRTPEPRARRRLAKPARAPRRRRQAVSGAPRSRLGTQARAAQDGRRRRVSFAHGRAHSTAGGTRRGTGTLPNDPEEAEVAPNTQRKRLSVVVPCFNEGAALDAFFPRLEAALAALPEYDHEVICVDDGSVDDTLQVLQRHHVRNPRIQVLELSRNFGKEAALTAGMDAAVGDAVIPIDADLQHPPEAIVAMVGAWEAGSDVVLARRASRADEPWLLRAAARWFYRLHNRLSEVPIPPDVGDFRLLDRRVVQALRQLPERQRFLKGLYAWVGFRQTTIEVAFAARTQGRSGFPAKARFALALDGITGFSQAPLRIWTYVGTSVALLALVYGSWIVVKTLLFGIETPGYASLLTAVLFLGGVQLLSVGVLGEYIGRIYTEAKQRPLYVVRSRNGAFDDLVAR